MNDKITSSDGLNLNSFEGSKKFNDYNFNQNANYSNSNNNNNNNASNKSNNMSGNECSEGCWKIFQPFAKIKYELTNNSWSELIYKCRNSRQLVLLVVFIALFFDNMLLTTVGKNYRRLIVYFLFVSFNFLISSFSSTHYS